MTSYNRKLYSTHLSPPEIYSSFAPFITENVLPFCEKWFQPHKDLIKNIDKQMRQEWKQYFKNHPEEKMINELINKDKLPGFNYLIYFEWCANKGGYEFILGSDYGVCVAVMTKSFQRHHIISQRNERNSVIQEAKQIAIDNSITILKAAYSADVNIFKFDNDHEKKVANLIEKLTKTDHGMYILFNLNS
ncbi:12803_t:CDS:1 [Funneliformis geosporum]|nr:12803_t:CDS:1 [Funneliformis geosporum]